MTSRDVNAEGHPSFRSRFRPFAVLAALTALSLVLYRLPGLPLTGREALFLLTAACASMLLSLPAAVLATALAAYLFWTGVTSVWPQNPALMRVALFSPALLASLAFPALAHCRCRLREMSEAHRRHILGIYSIFGLFAAFRDAYLENHGERVARYAAACARQMGLSAQEVTTVFLAGILHDIGKLQVPAAILQKPARLSEAEMTVVREHARNGEETLRKTPHLAKIAAIIRHHHERFDGTGYPDGLAGQDIPLASRILAVADAFDAMDQDRPYRPRLERSRILAELHDCSGTQFDPVVVGAFNRCLARLSA